MKFFYCVSLLFVIESVGLIYGKCVLSLNDDFGSPSPVYLRNGMLLAPEWGGNVTIRRGEALTVACPGERRNVVLGNETTDVKDVEALCVTNKSFRVGRWLGLFEDIRCNSQPWFLTEDIGACYEDRRNYRVGYRIREKFHTLYEACFDENLLSTLYVKHGVTPLTKYIQTGSKRPNFIEGELFGKVRMAQLYKNKSQKDRLDSVLGLSMAQEYITKNQFLTRGHLAPRADFSLRAEQRASFHYVNTAPQWMRGNAGDWAALEDAVRRRVQTLNVTVTVYTGTHGVLTLNNAKDQPMTIYLSTDDNNNDVVPVPLYFYKVIYEPISKKAAAFVSINSSFYNRTMTKSLTFCSDVCDSHYSWLSWRNDGTHSFCCDYQEFIEKIDYLPHLDVVGAFY